MLPSAAAVDAMEQPQSTIPAAALVSIAGVVYFVLSPAWWLLCAVYCGGSCVLHTLCCVLCQMQECKLVHDTQ